jgi:peptide/nickel transport system permease protein
MIAYLIKRTGTAILVIFGVTLVVMILEQLLPGGAARAILGQRATPAAIAAFNREHGLDQPFWVQYGLYVWGVLHGDLGTSYKLNEGVAYLIGLRLPKTLLLMALSYLVALAVAIPLGVLQAVRRNKVLEDYLPTGVTFFLYSMPVFWLALILVVIFSGTLRVLPPEAPQGPISTYWSQLPALVLPVVTLALLTIALFSRYMRSSMLDNLVQDYVRTARAKGASEFRVLFRHVLRNSLIPIITLLGLNLPAIFSGALVTEAVFNYPGMGLLFWNSAQDRDYPILLGIVLVVAASVVAGNLLADIGYAIVDPRIRYTSS